MEEPNSIRDLKWMRETSSGWFDGKVKHENIRKPGEPPIVGEEDYRSFHVVVSGDRVFVEDRVHIISEVRGESSWSSKAAVGSRHAYSFEEFRESEWWPLCMEAWKGGMTDSSWVDDARFDEYDDGVSLCMKVSSTYTDFLGNSRQCERVRPLRVYVEKSTGQVEVSIDGEEVSFTLDELLKMAETARLAKDNGVSIDAGGIRIDFGGGDAS